MHPMRRSVGNTVSKLRLQRLQPLSRGMAGPPPSRYDHTPEAIVEKQKLRDGHVNFKRQHIAPKSITDVMPATPQPMPENPAEIAVFNGFPAEHQNRTVIIAPRHDKTMQSGQGHVHQWQITWKNRERWSNPLMGWTSSADPMSNVRLTFDSEADAESYAIKNGWKFEKRAPVSESTQAPNEGKIYDHNFLPKRVQQEVKKANAGDKTDYFQFVNSDDCKSNWFQPLTYHGDSEVRQHGPRASNSDVQPKSTVPE